MDKNEYLDAVAALIYRSDPQNLGLKASTLGNLILRNLAQHWGAYGYPALKYLLEDLKSSAGFRVGRDHHDMLTVWAGTGPSQVAPPKERATPHEFKRLRKELWTAFVAAPSSGRRFLDRAKGTFVATEAHFQPVVPGDWVEIPRIPDDTQKGWARSILEEALDTSLLRVVNEPGWNHQLVSVLRDRRPDLLAKWNHARSAHVTAAAEEWCAGNGIAPNLVFLPDKKNSRTLPQSSDLRVHVLAALARMSTEQLLELSIPAKYLLTESSIK
jgi:hypothetical protein